MIIKASVTIDADVGKVWDTLTDLTCWKDWSTVITDVAAGEQARLKEGGPFRFCIRPFVLPVRLTPVVEEVVPYRKITWSGRKFGVVARHEFLIEESSGGVKVTSVETFTGLGLALAWFRLGEWRLRELTGTMLDELKRASESAKERR